MTPDTIKKAEKLLALCRKNTLRLAVAESCTGGLLSATLTEIPGASSVLDRGFVTYSNESKIDLLDVSPAILQSYGAVSKVTAQAMAEGALKHSQAHLVVAVTGIAGPGGGTKEKPVGLVYLAASSRKGDSYCERHIFKGSRQSIRQDALNCALDMLLKATIAYKP